MVIIRFKINSHAGLLPKATGGIVIKTALPDDQIMDATGRNTIATVFGTTGIFDFYGRGRRCRAVGRKQQDAVQTKTFKRTMLHADVVRAVADA